MKTYRLTNFPLSILLILIVFSTLHGQDNDFIKLKERYLEGEFEAGMIFSKPAYSLGIGVGRVHNEHLQVGLTLHFLINDLTHLRSDRREELRKLNLLGLKTLYRNQFSEAFGYFTAFSMNFGSVEYLRFTTSQNLSFTGFTMALKPEAGLFYKFNKKSRIYLGVKYLQGFIVEDREFFHGAPVISMGIRFYEIAF